jgi:hypothetical protein
MRSASSAPDRARARIACALGIVLAACAPATSDITVDVAPIMAHVDALVAIGPRPQDSDGSRTAAGYIEDELDRLGLDATRLAVGKVELPAIEVLGRLHRRVQVVDTTDPNLVVRLGPPGQALLIMAHYDTVAGSPGASDNAVAVALLLDLARHLQRVAPRQPILLAFTANEEIGLAGAEALAARPPCRRSERSGSCAGAIGDEVAFAISLDLLGGDGPLTVNGASMLIGRAELAWLAAAANRAAVALSTPIGHRVISRWWPQAERSDHGPFTRRGIRAIHFYNRGNDGEWIDLAYHSARDVPARIDRESVAQTARLLRALVASPVPARTGDGFWLPFVDNVVVPRGWLVACELALVALALVMLVLSRDGLVAAIARRRAGIPTARGPGLLVAFGCYVLAVALACVLERVLAGDHAAPWLHDPLHATIASALVIAGLVGVATRAIARFRPWQGEYRYRAAAAIACLVIGTVLLAIGAAELAWVWLVPAAALAVADKLGVIRVIAIACAVLPIVTVLHPLRLREAAWNGFLPEALPVAAWVGMLGAPAIAAVAWGLRRRPLPGPLGTLVLAVGWGLAVIVGLVFALALDVDCTAAKFESFHLACERV